MATPFIDFRPAEVRKNKETYILYYVLDPTSDKLKRMRVRCNRIKNRREQLRYATLLCAEINRKLYSGWNPLTGEDSSAKKRLSIVEAATNYVHRKAKDLLKDTGITEMLESGMPSKFVKDLAGHRSLSMTERYLHVSDAKRILQANRVRF
ncbi:MAG: tyrosine-type recombinase/integrase [Bacteroidales bacterium]|nr:tyrosine-type recombinase/integrase [Bacteroidales bacterium]